MSTLNEALEFREAICQEEIRFLKEKINTLEGKSRRFELVESRLNELEEENVQLRESLGKERGKIKELSAKAEHARLQESQYLSLESDTKSQMYRLEAINKNLERKLEQQQTHVSTLVTQNELLTSNLADFTRTNKIKVNQLIQQVSRLEAENGSLTLDRDETHKKWISVKEDLIQQNLNLEKVSQELAQTKSYCSQIESQCQENLDSFNTCSEEYKTVLFEKSVAVSAFEEANSMLKSQIEQLENKVYEQQELATAQLMNIAGTKDESSSPLLFYIQEYKKLGRYPEQIYKEFFEMREKHSQLTETYNEASFLTSRFENEVKDKNALLERLHQEVDSYKSKLEYSKQACNTSELQLKQLTSNLEKLETEHTKVTAEKKHLELDLQDISYQMQHLVYDIYKRQDPIPMAVKKTAEIMTAGVQLTSNLAHDDLVFKNISDLQNLNRKLSEKVRIQEELLGELKTTSTDFNNFNLDRELADIKRQLEKTQRELIEKEEKIDALQQELKHQSTSTQDGQGLAFTSLLTEFRNLNTAFNQYRASTTLDLAQLESDFKSSNQSEQELKNVVRSYQEKTSKLKSDLDQTQDLLKKTTNELNNARQESVSTYSQLKTQKCELDNISKELVNHKKLVDSLRTENITIKAELSAQSDAYDIVQKEKIEYNAERIKLNNTLNSINARIQDNELILADEIQVYKIQSNELSIQLKYSQDTIKALEKDLERVKFIQLPAVETQYKNSQNEISTLKEKLVRYEVEDLKKIEDSTTKADNFVLMQSSCEEHNELISELKAKVTILEEANEEYVVHIEDIRRKYSNVVNEQRKYVEEKDKYTQKLKCLLEERTHSLLASQKVAEKAKEEYGIMCDGLKTTQEKLSIENETLRQKNKQLEEGIIASRVEIEALNATAEEQKGACNSLKEKTMEIVNANEKLQEDITSLNNTIAELKKLESKSKQRLQEALDELTFNKEKYNDEATKWIQFQEDINGYRLEAEKSNSCIRDRLDQLIDIWTSSEDNTNTSELTDEMITLIRQHNAVATYKKEASDARYLEEYKKCKLLQQEIHQVKVNLSMAQDMISELKSPRYSNESVIASEDSLIYNAYKIQNQELVQNYKTIKKNAEETTQLLEKVKTELEPLKLRNVQLENELLAEREEKKFLLQHKDEWIARSAALPSKTSSLDSANMKTKASSNESKARIEDLEAEINILNKSAELWKEKSQTLQNELESTHASQANIVASSNQRQRLAVELRNRLHEANNKIAEYEAELHKMKETSHIKTAALDSPNCKSLEEALKKEQDSKHVLEQNLKSTEASLKTTENSLKKKTEEYISLKNQHTSLLNRARAINGEKTKMAEDIKTLKAELENCQKSKEENISQGDSSDTASKLTQCEAEIRRLEMSLQEHELEILRLRATNQVLESKKRGLEEKQKLIENKSQPFDVQDTDKQQIPKTGFKRDREGKEDISISSPKKK